MPKESRRKFDPEFGEGAVRVWRETGKPIARSLVILGSMRARSGIGSRVTRRPGTGPTGCRVRTWPS